MKSRPEAPALAESGVAGQPAAKGKSRRKLLIKSAVSIGLIAFILSRVDIAQTLGVLSGANLALLMLAFSLTFVGALLTAGRWGTMLRAQGVDSSLRHLVACWLTACFFNQFLPSTIGGDAIRIYDSWKLGATKAGAAAAIGVDRLLGLFVLMLFGVIALYLSSLLIEQHPEIWLLVVGGALGLGAIAAWIFWPSPAIEQFVQRTIGMLPGKLQRLAEKFHGALLIYQGEGKVLAKGLLLSICLQLNVVLFYFFVGLALELPLSFLDYMLVIPIANVVLLLPVTINGVGLREGIFVLLLGAFSVPPASAVAFAWASFALFLIYGLIGGVVYALRGDRVRQV